MKKRRKRRVNRKLIRYMFYATRRRNSCAQPLHASMNRGKEGGNGEGGERGGGRKGRKEKGEEGGGRERKEKEKRKDRLPIH